jgi:hypothetical protein
VLLQDKLAYVVSVVESCWASGRPVLIGTSSVNESELVLRVLQDWCRPEFRPLAARVQLLNAKPENVRLEAQVRGDCILSVLGQGGMVRVHMGQGPFLCVRCWLLHSYSI